MEWAIAAGCLQIRVATVVPPDGRVTGAFFEGIYHEKLGLLARKAFVEAFEGSANETAAAYTRNYERLLFHAPGVATSAVEEHFERLWENATPGVSVLPLHDAFRAGLMTARNEQPTVANSVSVEDASVGATADSVPPEILRRPARFALRDYQQAAIDGWFAARGVGIYAMATGTGKTFTALCTAEELYRRAGGPLAVVIVAPYLNLVSQWLKEGRRFGLDPLECSGSRHAWKPAADATVHQLNAGTRLLATFATTNATFSGDAFQDMLDSLKVRTLLIADEVHNLGARNLRAALPERVTLRLGLSATPSRWMDQEGTAAVNRYFGSAVADVSLGDALKMRPPVLTPYKYFPILIELDDDEREEYLLLTKQLARFMADPRDENLSETALGLLLKRARLLGSASGKLPALRTALEPHRKSRFNLIYCGDGRVEIESAVSSSSLRIGDGETVRQVKAAAAMASELGMTASTYTAEVSANERADVMSAFEEGTIQALVAIRCLDEGVDVPAVRRAFILASSTNPRQFIQRRGRVLRRAEGKELAEIYDFVVVPPAEAADPDSPEYRPMRGLLEREFARVAEFADLALNGPQARATLLPTLEALGLSHL
ncbi:DEAD/DEAH box helicase family protein [Alienimonas californiensis]|uniref:Type III restriction enzyme, res subunit n=1 Tax=Alienimonas californiensis TaxID=2527989 RepID=A0A517PBP3_9PLAN|nr:DEAD/DEAH box helicase family protein [Alienimonas californiensis]QDT16782.1 Type III restriction enzyme, res subunit [Alienimonas californiensis]